MDKPKTDYDEKEFYWVSGKVLNEIGKMILERTPIAGNGMEETQAKDGVTLGIQQQGLPTWRSFTDCEGNTFEVLTRGFTAAA